MNTAIRLRQLMDERGLKQKDIVDMCQPFCAKYGEKIGKSHVSQWVSGKHDPDQKRLSILGMALNVSEGWLIGLDVPMERTEQPNIVPFPSNLSPAPRFNQKPRVGRIACGLPILAEQNIEDYDYVPDNIKCDFTLQCRGDSMINARIFDGDIICIRAQEEVESGQIAAVMVGDSEATLKRVRIYDDHIVLEAENPQYKPLVFWEEQMNEVHVTCPDYILDRLLTMRNGRTEGRIFTFHPNTLVHHIHKVCANAGITDTTVHGLRHTNAAVMRYLGVSDAYAMERGGWTEERTYKNIYSYVFDSTANKEGQIIDDFFGSKAKNVR